LALAEAAGQKELAGQIRQRCAGYEAGQPYRQGGTQ
jgi:hypothetical protein